MLELYFVRHGETEWNVEHRLQGRLNSNLTEKGIRDAQLLGKRLEDTDFDAAHVSPSKRAMETAKLIIGERRLPFKQDKRLMEINLGNWEGRTMEEIEAMDPVGYDLYHNHPSQFKGTGESFADVKARIEAVLKDLENTYQSGRILIVTHGMVVKVLQTICKNVSLDFVWEPPLIEGTSITIVKAEGGNRDLMLEGDISHKENKVM